MWETTDTSPLWDGGPDRPLIDFNNPFSRVCVVPVVATGWGRRRRWRVVDDSILHPRTSLNRPRTSLTGEVVGPFGPDERGGGCPQARTQVAS